MASPKTSTDEASPKRPKIVKPPLRTAFFVGDDAILPKGVSGVRLRISDKAYKVLTQTPNRVKALLQGYGEAVAKSRAAGRAVSFRVDIDPEGTATVTPVEEVASARGGHEEAEPQDVELQAALAAARARGRLRAAEILGGEDMLSADDFAKLIGTSRVTVNAKRRRGELLGLTGAKRGYRFPVWQLDAEGKPLAQLAALHEQLGGAWATYRFLVQPHGELDGLTGREALDQGRVDAVLAAAESVGRDFR